MHMHWVLEHSLAKCDSFCHSGHFYRKHECVHIFPCRRYCPIYWIPPHKYLRHKAKLIPFDSENQPFLIIKKGSYNHSLFPSVTSAVLCLAEFVLLRGAWLLTWKTGAKTTDKSIWILLSRLCFVLIMPVWLGWLGDMCLCFQRKLNPQKKKLLYENEVCWTSAPISQTVQPWSSPCF